MKLIPMHLGGDQVFKSNLFGMNGKELIQLVDPSDTKRLQLFKHHSNPQDQEAQDCFTLIEDTAKLRAEIDSWKRGVKITWIWRHWMAMLRKCRGGNDTWLNNRMEDVWNGPRDDENGEPLDMSLPHTYMREGYTYGEVIDDTRYTPNMDHPWVQNIVANMPTFRPTIMFRLFVNDCKQTNGYFRSLKWKKPDSDEYQRKRRVRSAMSRHIHNTRGI
jgi:hypothetical protein